ncbi:YheC/YheD family endospore coat-associated protein [Metabacillus halosaccharovorans]|uniref:YheC/YheD family protein n=1 Tax=Metabacillus halosaccharovorans TaxID=930124 RepID=A0ABT3DLS8_9BACI|nr:YheC/YheD family protein [Metabacillus halosaccharovorans]MCV9887821.1 YheC/YheD family protein [Metabacillus halosaccharovorans]
MTHRYVGILVSSFVYRGIIRGNTDYENIQFYEDIGKKLNIVPCYFRLTDIKPGVSEVKALIKQNSEGYRLSVIPKPSVIHNRIFTNTTREKKIIKELQNEGVFIFNENNRYKKLTIHEILLKNNELIPYVPETVRAGKANLIYMMKKYNELILKPNSGSLGVGISKLTRINSRNWELSYYQKKSLNKERFSTNLPSKLKDLLSSTDVLIQQRIPLALSKGVPFDMRVSVQKNETGEWQVSGIVGKVAKKGRFITNVAQGGTCFPIGELLKDLPHLNHEKVLTDINLLALNIVINIEQEIPNLADLGLDIGITHDGKPMIIECNGRDLRVTFRNAGMLEEWEETYATPMKYANYLYETLLREKGAVHEGN